MTTRGKFKKEPEEPYIDYRSLKKKMPKKFAALVKEHRACTDQEVAAKSRKDEIKDQLLAMMIVAKQRRLLVDNLRIRQSTGRHSQISAKKLLEKGVGSDVIQACTVTNTYDYVTVDAVPEEDDLVE